MPVLSLLAAIAYQALSRLRQVRAAVRPPLRVAGDLRGAEQPPQILVVHLLRDCARDVDDCLVYHRLWEKYRHYVVAGGVCGVAGDSGAHYHRVLPHNPISLPFLLGHNQPNHV